MTEARNHLAHLTDDERKEIRTKYVLSSAIDRELDELVEQFTNDNNNGGK